MRKLKNIKVNGAIVPNDDKWIYNLFDIEAVCPKDIEKELDDAKNAKNEEVTIQINSGGGDIGAGNEISYLIGQYPGAVTADITGYCCSAATLISCAADSARMMPSALFMIHNVSGAACGDYNVMDHKSGVLKTANEAIAAAYCKKTGKTAEELLDLMNSETWMNAEKAKNYGFIDEIIESKSEKPRLLNSAPGQLLSDSTLDKIRNEFKQKKKADEKVASAKLKLLKMKGEIL